MDSLNLYFSRPDGIMAKPFNGASSVSHVFIDNQRPFENCLVICDTVTRVDSPLCLIMSTNAPNIHQSRFNIKIPNACFLSYVFSVRTTQQQKPQYIDAFRPNNYYNLAQGQVLARRVGLGLRNLGIKDDDRILLYSNNNLYFLVLLWGVIAAEAILLAMSETTSSAELENQVKDLGARLILTSLDGLAVAGKAALRAGVSRENIFIFCDPSDKHKIPHSAWAKPWTSFWASEQQISGWTWKNSDDIEYLHNKTIIIN